MAMDSKKKILLIDDDKDFLMATKLILEKGGTRFSSQRTGNQGSRWPSP